MRAWASKLIGALVMVGALSGCAHKQKAVVTAEETPYRIGREDVLDIAVWRDPDLSRVLPVRPDGFISLPMVGELKAEGKTPLELAAEVKEKLTPIVQEPKVAVIVREVNSSRVYVTGEVAHPGAYPLRGRLSLLQAISLAGGFSDFASTDSIVIMRKTAGGTQIPVRYSDVVDSENPNADVTLQPGDTVVVP